MDKIIADIDPSELDNFEVFPWNDNFETGNELIDEQHKVLVSMLNKLAMSLVIDETIEINDAFAELAAYANKHFDEEEAIWAEHFIEDSWLTSHQMSHAAFLPKVLEIKEQDTGQPLRDKVETIVKFLIRWLAFHIIDDDKRLAFVVENIKKGASLDEAKLAADKKMSGSMRVLIETILNMYDGLSSRTLDLMRERRARAKAEKELMEANKRLEQMSITDQLTGLYNRRHFETVFHDELRRARREKHELTYFMIDLDYFKNFNDIYGHLEGDLALERVGAKLSELCRRPGDYAFRMGGEEFSILTSGMEATKPEVFGEILRAGIEDLQIAHQGSEVSDVMTASIGVASKIPNMKDNVDDCMRIADERLYLAKEKGRNQVVWDGISSEY